MANENIFSDTRATKNFLGQFVKYISWKNNKTYNFTLSCSGLVVCYLLRYCITLRVVNFSSSPLHSFTCVTCVSKQDDASSVYFYLRIIHKILAKCEIKRASFDPPYFFEIVLSTLTHVKMLRCNIWICIWCSICNICSNMFAILNGV